MTKQPLFRPEATAVGQSSPFGSVIISRPVAFSVWVLLAATAAMAVLGFCYFVQYATHVQVSGVLVPGAGLTKIYSPRAGIIVERLVKDGQHVNAGDILYVVSTELITADPKGGSANMRTSSATLEKMAMTRESLLLERKDALLSGKRQRANLVTAQENLKLQLHKLDRELALQAEKTDAAKAQYRYQTQLQSQGYISALALQQRKGELLDQQARLEGLERNRLQLLRDSSSASNDLELHDDKQNRTAADYARQLLLVEKEAIGASSAGQILITAPHAGRVSTILGERGQTVTTQALLTLLPEAADLYAEVYIPSSAVGSISVSDKLAIRIGAFPYLKFGKIDGIVEQISQSTLDEENGSVATAKSAVGKNSDGIYRVKVRLEKQAIYAYGKKRPLMAGMKFDTEIVQERRTLLEWFFEPIYKLKAS